MGRIYACTYNGTLANANGDADLFEVVAASNKPVKLRGFMLSQSTETDQEGLRITVKRLPATFTSGSGGSSVTPIPCDSADAAAGATVEMNNSTVSTTNSTAVTLWDGNWNVNNSPFDFWWPDSNYAPKAKNGEGLVIRLESTPADDITASITVWIEEE